MRFKEWRGDITFQMVMHHGPEDVTTYSKIKLR